MLRSPIAPAAQGHFEVNDPLSQGSLSGIKLWVVAIALATGTLMQVLDNTIANVSLTTIAGNLGVSPDSSTWTITAFGAANGASVPLSGWLVRRFGLVKTFVSSVTLFTVASLLCGIAWNLPALIVFRLAQGAVSGPMIPGSQALLMSIFPPSQRSLALGIWSMTTLSGPIAGPLLGGYISDNFHWGWIFLINVPVGFACATVTWHYLRKENAPLEKVSVDKVGIILLVIWVGALQVCLDLGVNLDWMNSSTIVNLAAVAAVGFLSWVIWELSDESPAVDLRLFRDRNFALGTLAFCLGYALFFMNNLLYPLWLQKSLGYTATWAGLVSAPSGVMAVLMTPFLARFTKGLDGRVIATFAFLAFSGSYFVRSRLVSDVDFTNLVYPLLIIGPGMGVFFSAMMVISLDGVDENKMAGAIGLSNFARITSASFAASLLSYSWSVREALHQSRLSEVVGRNNGQFLSVLQEMGRNGLTERQAVSEVSQQMVKQADLLAATDIFWVSGVGSLLMIVVIWLCRRPESSTALPHGE